MPLINGLTALEILDSRGRPTVRATCVLEDGCSASASVPSGASTGRAEALELRDGEARYGGLGCRKAVHNVETIIAESVVGRTFATQKDLDEHLIALDGTPNKSTLGANAILAVSLAFARAHAKAQGRALYMHFAAMQGLCIRSLPRLTVNLFSGGKHAGGQVAIQDVLIVPTAVTINESLATAYAIYQAAVQLSAEKFGMRYLTADEGGLAPPFENAQAMLDNALAAIKVAGLVPGRDVVLAVDVASSHFYRDDRYHLEGKALSGQGMIEMLLAWVGSYPIVSLEDGLAEEDWAHWPMLHAALGSGVLVLGDDLLCTHPNRIARAVKELAANALLLKVNQIGTLTEAAYACALAKDAGWQIAVSARSGETEDDWLADLAVGWAGDQIKVGSITQSERLAKYNRLLAIEAETELPVVTLSPCIISLTLGADGK